MRDDVTSFPLLHTQSKCTVVSRPPNQDRFPGSAPLFVDTEKLPAEAAHWFQRLFLLCFFFSSTFLYKVRVYSPRVYITARCWLSPGDVVVVQMAKLTSSAWRSRQPPQTWNEAANNQSNNQLTSAHPSIHLAGYPIHACVWRRCSAAWDGHVPMDSRTCH